MVVVLSAEGEVAYYGEIQSVPNPNEDDAVKFKILNPETEEVHEVAYAEGEGFREATEAESDAYIERWD